MSGALEGIRVIEMGSLIAGPFCGQLLGDMGADVIKIEQPGEGDPMRQWGQGAKPAWWRVIARNKRSVALNLRLPRGQEIARDLIGQADILVENFRPGTLEKWGMAPEALHVLNPHLIIVRVSGYGQTGPYADRAGFGLVGEAMGGWRYLVGEPDRPPARMGLSIGDTLAATFGCMGALAALHAREKTGRGQVVDSALYEAVLQVTESLLPDLVRAATCARARDQSCPESRRRTRIRAAMVISSSVAIRTRFLRAWRKRSVIPRGRRMSGSRRTMRAVAGSPSWTG